MINVAIIALFFLLKKEKLFTRNLYRKRKIEKLKMMDVYFFLVSFGEKKY